MTTGIDWFELGGQVDFGGQEVALPDLLDAARRGETMVTLGDGSMGMLPEDWLKKYGMLVDLGTAENGHLRFSSAQAGLLDALLAAQPEIQVDAGFAKVRAVAPRVRGGQAARGPAGLPRRAAALPVRGPGLARLPPAVRLRRHPRRRHGPGQDDPGPRPAPAAAVAAAGEGAVAGRRAPLAGLQLDRRRPASSPPGSGCSTTPARTGTPSAKSSTTTT